jgi:hypothetical protein
MGEGLNGPYHSNTHTHIHTHTLSLTSIQKQEAHDDPPLTKVGTVVSKVFCRYKYVSDQQHSVVKLTQPATIGMDAVVKACLNEAGLKDVNPSQLARLGSSNAATVRK